MAKKFGKGDKVAITRGRHKGIVGRVTKPPDITTSMNEIEPEGRPRKIKVTSRNAEKLAEPKQSLFDWLRSK